MVGIKGVYADLAGVILFDGFPPAVDGYAKRHGIDSAILQRAKDKYWVTFSLGKISAEQFWQKTFGENGIKLSDYEARRINKEVLDAHYPYSDVLASAKDLHQRCALGLLTNTPHEWLEYWNNSHQLREVFPIVVIPFETGMRKPDVRMFRYAARKMELKPEEILFVDDQKKNVEAAKHAGMIAKEIVPGSNPFLELIQDEG